MDITFRISNIITEKDKIRAFYEFSNGQSNSNVFSASASVDELMKWGNERAEFFAKREIELETRVEELTEQIN